MNPLDGSFVGRAQTVVETPNSSLVFGMTRVSIRFTVVGQLGIWETELPNSYSYEAWHPSLAMLFIVYHFIAHGNCWSAWAFQVSEYCVVPGCGSRAVHEVSHRITKFAFSVACVFLHKPATWRNRAKARTWSIYKARMTALGFYLPLVFAAYSTCVIQNSRRGSRERPTRRPGNLMEQTDQWLVRRISVILMRIPQGGT